MGTEARAEGNRRRLAKAYQGRGLAFYQQSKCEDALSDCNQAILVDDQYYMAYACLGFVHLALEDYEPAIIELDKAISKHPDRPELLNARGIAHDEMGNYELALEDFNQAIGIEPGIATFYYNRGTLFIEMGDNQKAIDDLKTYLKWSSPGDEKREEAEAWIEYLEPR